MDSFQEINWSAVARQAFDQKISDLELLNEIKADSSLTDQDALKLGRELSERLAKRHEAHRRREHPVRSADKR
ncbi:hypothetical protein KY327_03945 [Candidatus Woesearchaeota archaeon]|nr:hypothetical protein [Candidatus Woesearchaeota archaeon]